jgi:NAD(P)-dependent dehydrogenase (short-subunit alcohol dehydrogenase family)
VKNKICIVTGGNTGIGKATALGLARQGATVVIACRDAGKGEASRAEIAASTGSQDVHVLPLDLASLGSVRAFAAAFTTRFARLDVLVENAGVLTSRRQLTADGLEMDFGVNHVGHHLLAELLLPCLKASAPSRIVVVSSNLHAGATLDFDDLQGEKRWSRGAYGKSKLANLLFVRALSRRLEGSGVVVNGLHPGVIATELARDFPRPVQLVARWFFKSPEQGARTSLHLATSPDAGAVSGRYFVDSKEKRPSAAAQDDAAAERLWTETERLVARAAVASSPSRSAGGRRLADAPCTSLRCLRMRLPRASKRRIVTRPRLPRTRRSRAGWSARGRDQEACHGDREAARAHPRDDPAALDRGGGGADQPCRGRGAPRRGRRVHRSVGSRRRRAAGAGGAADSRRPGAAAQRRLRRHLDEDRPDRRHALRVARLTVRAISLDRPHARI